MGADGVGRWRCNRFTVADDAFVSMDLDQDHFGAVSDALGPVKGFLVGDPERRRHNFADLHVPSSGARLFGSPRRSSWSQAPVPVLETEKDGSNSGIERSREISGGNGCQPARRPRMASRIGARTSSNVSRSLVMSLRSSMSQLLAGRMPSLPISGKNRTLGELKSRFWPESLDLLGGGAQASDCCLTGKPRRLVCTS